jgi:hypothetical protein
MNQNVTVGKKTAHPTWLPGLSVAYEKLLVK